jgi:hypothetical protein
MQVFAAFARRTNMILQNVNDALKLRSHARDEALNACGVWV